MLSDKVALADECSDCVSKNEERLTVMVVRARPPPAVHRSSDRKKSTGAESNSGHVRAPLQNTQNYLERQMEECQKSLQEMAMANPTGEQAEAEDEDPEDTD